MAWHFVPPAYAKPRDPALIMAALHGDAPLGVHCLARLAHDLIERPPGRDTWIIPMLNVDGIAGGSKNNANNVDLDRNFASTTWSADHSAGYFPGKAPGSEPEVAALCALIERTGVTRLVSLNSPFHLVHWDGAGQALAAEMAQHNGYSLAQDTGHPSPGSFGSLYGGDKGLEVVTLELPLVEVEEAWAQNRTALRWSLDLPS